MVARGTFYLAAAIAGFADERLLAVTAFETQIDCFHLTHMRGRYEKSMGVIANSFSAD